MFLIFSVTNLTCDFDTYKSLCGWTSSNSSTNPSYWTWIESQIRTINFTGALNPVGNKGKTFQINQSEELN